MELGRYGVFGHARVLTVERARVLESLGYETVWQGGSPPADLAHVTAILDATSTLKVATGIVNVWTADAAEVARSYHRIEAAHPGGSCWAWGRASRGRRHGSPAVPDSGQLPRRADAEGVPLDRQVLAALGPRVLRLAAERTGGAHPYLVTPEHTRQARGILGPGKLLAPEQRVVLEADPARARALGRESVSRTCA